MVSRDAHSRTVSPRDAGKDARSARRVSDLCGARMSWVFLVDQLGRDGWRGVPCANGPKAVLSADYEKFGQIMGHPNVVQASGISATIART